LTTRGSAPTVFRPFFGPDLTSLRTTFSIDPELQIGGDNFVVMAGPCAVESEELLFAAADAVAGAGAALLRGGAFKPRTSPTSFQGLGSEGLSLLAQASQRTGLPVVTEVMDTRDVALVAEHAAMLQVGSRNMQNFPLLREVGRQKRPVLLKRGAAATIEELLLAAEYILQEGNPNVILCERGVRGFDPSTRYVLDLAAIPVLRERSPLPIIVDPSHGTGHARYVPSMARAAMVAGADGLLIEVHANPALAKCDGHQALTPEIFAKLMVNLHELAPLCGRVMRSVAATDSARGTRSSRTSGDAAGSLPTGRISAGRISAGSKDRRGAGQTLRPSSLDDEVIAP